MSSLPIRFTGRTEEGLSKGHSLGFPTINIQLSDVPEELAEGIYACEVRVDGDLYGAAMHCGPRPAVRAGPSCEVHLLDAEFTELPGWVEVTVIKRLRDVMDFPTMDALSAQIAEDVRQTRETLAQKA